MSFIEMDPELAWKLIEGYPNELEPESRKLDAFYRQFQCPQCKGNCIKEISAAHAFQDPDTLVPRSLLRCRVCSCLFNPHVLSPRGEPMVIEMGSSDKGL